MSPVRTLLTRSPSDTNVPGFSQRRIWSAPDVTSHSLFVLTLPRIYLTPLSGAPKPDFVKAVEHSLDLDATLGPLTTMIELSHIRRVRLELSTNSLVIEYQAPRSAVVKTTITFSSAEIADTAFGKLWRRLGSEFGLRPHDDDSWLVARAPLAFIAALLVGTAALALTTNALTDFAAIDRWWFTRLLPNWQVICGLGGFGVAIAQIWLYRRMAVPPERLELIREDISQGKRS